MGASYSFWDRLLKFGPEINFLIRTNSTMEQGWPKIIGGLIRILLRRITQKRVFLRFSPPNSTRISPRLYCKVGSFEKIDLWTKFQYSISKTVGCPHLRALNISDYWSPLYFYWNSFILKWTDVFYHTYQRKGEQLICKSNILDWNQVVKTGLWVFQ